MEIFALIDAYDRLQEKFRDSRINSRSVWNDIADYVNEHCHSKFNGRQCNRRWNYLRRQYVEKIKFNGRTRQSAKAAKWPYWDNMKSVLGNDPSVVPSVIAGSKGVRRLVHATTTVSSPDHSDDYTADNSQPSSSFFNPTVSRQFSRRSSSSGSRPKRARDSRQDIFLSEIRRMHDEKIQAFKEAEAEKCGLLRQIMEHLQKNNNCNQ